MKRLFGCGFFVSLFLISCTSKDVSIPNPSSVKAFYQDNNVEVETLTPTQTSSNNVSVSFSTSYLKNIVRVEVMSSDNVNTFCTTSALDINTSASSLTTYTLSDNVVKGPTMHYMLRFKDAAGNWSYTGYKDLQIQ